MKDEQISKRHKKEVLDKAIRDGGFYGKNGVWNSIIKFSGDDKLYRERVETIIVKDKKFVFVKKKPNGEYYLPGGSTEKDLPHIEQAVNECKEEAHINVRNIQSTGITYKEKHETPNWAKRECEVEWQGMYTEVYVAEYDSIYRGHVDKVDEDPFIRSGKFYTTKECFRFFRKEHKEALLWYLKSVEDETEVTESYMTNYFKNKKLLKKISHNPEIERSAVEQIISTLKRKYGELMATSKIQREQKRNDVSEIFHPILTFDFSDGNTITICICFDKEEFSDGVAIHSDTYGDMIIVYPIFFKSTKENQIFTILHEFGHIRLHHLERWNYKRDIFGNDKTLDYRRKMMNKGKVMYPEVNADLYAILNGATMYSILNSTFNKDYDDKYDYRFTNQELANRYNQVFKQYGNLRGYSEYALSKYDSACLAIYEMVYNDESKLSTSEKDELYSILFEYAINKKIKDDKNLQEKEKMYTEALSLYNEVYDKYKYLISNTIEKYDSENDNDMNLNESSELVDTLGETIIPEKIEVMKLKNNVNNAYASLTFERETVYESACTLDFNNNGIMMGNNPKMAKLSNEKNILKNDIIEMVESITQKLGNTRNKAISEGISTDKIDHYLYLFESLSKKERDKIPESKFGIPETKSYPLDTKKHVHSAIVLFGKSDEKYREELSKRIFAAMDKFDIPMDTIGPKSQLYKYI